MTRLTATAAAAALFGAVVATAPLDDARGRPAQVPLHEEPHSRTLLYTARLRLLAINIPAGETSADHRHDYDVASVALGMATTRSRRPGEEWTAPGAREAGSVNITEYTGMPGIHRVEAVGTMPLRLMAIENVREGKWSVPAPLAAAGTTLIQQSRAFGVYEVRLDGRTRRTTHAHEVPAVAVLVSGAFENQGGGGESSFRLQQPGRWLLTPMGQAHTMSVADGGTAHIVEFEAR